VGAWQWLRVAEWVGALAVERADRQAARLSVTGAWQQEQASHEQVAGRGQGRYRAAAHKAAGELPG